MDILIHFKLIEHKSSQVTAGNVGPHALPYIANLDRQDFA